VSLGIAAVTETVGCRDEVLVEPVQQSVEAASTELESVSGVDVSQEAMRSSLSELTRQVALALADDQLRQLVYRAIRESPYPESKLHFRSFLAGQGEALRNRVAAVGSRTPAELSSVLDSLIDLEFYMPVLSHRLSWDGGPDLLVASSLQDDGQPPIAYNLRGERINLTSATVAPTTPTLGLVPVETDFSATPGALQAVPGAAAEEDEGVYMTHSVVFDNHEGFLHGVPEFEVHTFKRDVYGTFVDLQCASAGRSSPLYYDQNDEAWSGEVMLVLATGIRGDSVYYQVWEDDTEPCTASGGRPPKTSSATKAAIASAGAGYARTIYDAATGNWISSALTGAMTTLNLVVSAQRDDFVGFISLEGCWSATGSSNFAIKDEDGDVQGYAALDYRFDERTPVCTAPEPLPYGSVNILGPTEAPPSSECYFESYITGGTAPYSQYRWYRGGQQIGTGTTVTVDTYSSDFDLKLSVYDDDGHPGSQTLRIHVDPNAMECYY